MSIIDKAIKEPEIAFALKIVRIFSEDVYTHSVSVAEITEKIIADSEKFSESEKIEIVKGALLHDIGKIFVPFNLTSAPKKLNDIEYSLVKTHTLIGYELLKDSFSETVCNIALCHHEKPNGGGYESGIPLSKIPEEALIVQIADVYDALRNERPYKIGYEPKVALQIMKADAKNLQIDDGYLKILMEKINE